MKHPPPTTQKTTPFVSPKLKETKRCFRCKGLGYIAFDCPNNRVVTLDSYQALFEDEMELDGGEEQEVYLNDALKEVIEGWDEWECLVVRKILSGLAT